MRSLLIVLAVLVAGCSGTSDRAGSGGPDPSGMTTVASDELVRVDPDSAFVPLQGFEYVELPQAGQFALDQYRQMAAGIAGERAPQVAGRSVAKDGEGWAIVYVYATPLTEAEAAVPGAREAALKDSLTEYTSTEPVAIEGETLHFAVTQEEAPLTNVLVWQRDVRVQVQIRGTDRSKMQAVAAAFVRSSP